MGMYTELFLHCELDDTLPDDVATWLQWQTDNGRWSTDTEPPLPDDPFFSDERYQMIGRGVSASHVGRAMIFDRLDPDWGDKGWRLLVICSIKNYTGTYEKFVKMLHPHIVCFEHYPKPIGWHHYEEEDFPSLIVVQRKEKD